MKTLNLHSFALKFLATLPAKQFRQVVSKIFALLNNSTPNDAIKLKGYPYHRVDAGEYRIIYSFTDSTVIVQLIGKRNDDEAYKHLKQK